MTRSAPSNVASPAAPERRHTAHNPPVNCHHNSRPKQPPTGHYRLSTTTPVNDNRPRTGFMGPAAAGMSRSGPQPGEHLNVFMGGGSNNGNSSDSGISTVSAVSPYSSCAGSRSQKATAVWVANTAVSEEADYCRQSNEMGTNRNNNGIK